MQAVLRDLDVATKIKDPRGGSSNDLSVLDRRIQSLKQSLAARLKDNPYVWQLEILLLLMLLIFCYG